MANGTMHGEDTSCAKSNTFCPELWYKTHYSGRERSTRFGLLSNHIAPKYGEYVDFYGSIKFTESQLSASNAYYVLQLSQIGKSIFLTLLFSLSIILYLFNLTAFIQ